MNVWLFISGLILVGFVFFDALWTTLWSEGGAGPLSDRLSSWLWKGAKKIAVSNERDVNHKVLSVAGPAVLVLTVATWLVLLWTSMIMMFESHPQAVLDATTKAPGDLTDRIWFVLYTTTTVGNGDFMPGTDSFQVVSGLCAAGGMVLLTLSITYAIQVLSAVVEKRSFASEVMSLGGSAVEIAKTLQTAQPSGLSSQLSSLGSRLGTVTEQHKAYPIVHYYHPTEQSRSTGCAVAGLDEALRIYMRGINPQETELRASIVRPMRRSISTFLDTLKETFLSAAEEAPARPDKDRLRDEGVDLTRPDELDESADDEKERRKLLVNLVDYDGWHWNDVVHG